MTEPIKPPDSAPVETQPDEEGEHLVQEPDPVQTEPVQPPAQKLPPQWAVQLQAGLKILQEQLAQLPAQAQPPAWFKPAAAVLPKKVAAQVDLLKHLRHSEERAQKAREKQTGEILSALTRAVTASGKHAELQLGQQLKDLSNRLKAVEKTLTRIQRKQK